MKSTPLEEMYYDYTATEEYAAHASTERIAIDKREIDSLLEKITPEAFRNEISDAITSICVAYESNGYVLGFERSMNILTQCGIVGGA